jgi:hypothetical protein
MHLRFETRNCPRMRHRWRIWDIQNDKAFTGTLYRSKHKCNKAVDKLNGLSNVEGRKYRFAKTGNYHG